MPGRIKTCARIEKMKNCDCNPGLSPETGLVGDVKDRPEVERGNGRLIPAPVVLTKCTVPATW